MAATAMCPAETHPELTVVIDHLANCPPGQPEELKKLLSLDQHRKAFVKISHTWSLSSRAYPHRHSQQQLKRRFDVFGPRGLMWTLGRPVERVWPF